jgi:hypothetical protein
MLSFFSKAPQIKHHQQLEILPVPVQNPYFSNVTIVPQFILLHIFGILGKIRMTFFKKAAKKTVLQGLSAWFLYQVFYLLNSLMPEESDSLSNVLVEKFLYRIGIPAIATFGFEELVSKLYGTEFDKELAGINLLAVLIAAASSASLLDLKMENMVPFGLYALGIYYRFFAEGEAFFPLESQDNLQQPPRRYLFYR